MQYANEYNPKHSIYQMTESAMSTVQLWLLSLVFSKLGELLIWYH